MTEKRKYANRKKYLIAAVAKRRRKIKLMAIEYTFIISMAKNLSVLAIKDILVLGKEQNKN
ncbi:MAG: hypothetical protein PHT82_02785 [Candidatus Portnoybacteria bacterium]|jgi:hypothetical protein|nr:hypothetical protein [Candidatus Portnoybacteria bacterium]MDD5752427.1 hypothetical protein [Candidatus Portnoybacteria bacterium]HOZ16518.1 hypothetical protein [Candidatus Portnoybacteria bacterium]